MSKEIIQSLMGLGQLREAQYTLAHNHKIQEQVNPVITRLIQHEIRQAQNCFINIINEIAKKEDLGKEYFLEVLDPHEFAEDLDNRVIDNKLGL